MASTPVALDATQGETAPHLWQRTRSPAMPSRRAAAASMSPLPSSSRLKVTLHACGSNTLLRHRPMLTHADASPCELTNRAQAPDHTLTTSTLPPSSSWNSLRQVLSVLYTQSSRSSSAAMSEDVAMGRGHAACVDCVMLNHNGGGDCCLMRKGKSRGVRSPHTVLTKSAPANQLCIHCEKKKSLAHL